MSGRVNFIACVQAPNRPPTRPCCRHHPCPCCPPSPRPPACVPPLTDVLQVEVRADPSAQKLPAGQGCRLEGLGLGGGWRWEEGAGGREEEGGRRCVQKANTSELGATGVSQAFRSFKWVHKRLLLCSRVHKDSREDTRCSR